MPRVHADLHGLWVPIITPFTAADEVDEGSLRRLAHHLLAEGATGLIALGTTGEPATLSSAERRAAVATCADVCRSRRRPFLIGAGTNSTRSTIDASTAMPDETPGSLVSVSAMKLCGYHVRPAAAGAR